MNFPFVLWKARPDDSSVRFVSVEDLPNSGLRSVYQFSEADAGSMTDLSSFKSFKGTVYSEELLIDTDTQEASEACERRLKELNLSFKKFTTGNRGHHYHVKRSGVAGHTLPATDRLFVEVEFPGADLSFYHHVGLYRNIGAKHVKTGKRKELLYEHTGKELVLNPKSADELTPQTPTTVTQTEGASSVFLDDILKRITVPYFSGERRQGLISVALALHRLNQSFEFALGYLHNVNIMGDPIETKELIRILEWAYYGRDK
jgi:hypothetical protein